MHLRSLWILCTGWSHDPAEFKILVKFQIQPFNVAFAVLRWCAQDLTHPTFTGSSWSTFTDSFNRGLYCFVFFPANIHNHLQNSLETMASNLINVIDRPTMKSTQLCYHRMYRSMDMLSIFPTCYYRMLDRSTDVLQIFLTWGHIFTKLLRPKYDDFKHQNTIQ